MLDVYKNINDYNEDKERKILIVFDDMIADIINNKKLNNRIVYYSQKTKHFPCLYYVIIS